MAFLEASGRDPLLSNKKGGRESIIIQILLSGFKWGTSSCGIRYFGYFLIKTFGIFGSKLFGVYGTNIKDWVSWYEGYIYVKGQSMVCNIKYYYILVRFFSYNNFKCSVQAGNRQNAEYGMTEWRNRNATEPECDGMGKCGMRRNEKHGMRRNGKTRNATEWIENRNITSVYV